MATEKEIKSYKLLESNFPPVKPIRDAVLYILNSDGVVETYITDMSGIPIPLKDETTAADFISSDGSISISGVSPIDLTLESSLTSLINNAIQSGDNISDLTNDIGYLTDAPVDGSEYVRLNGAWVVASGGASQLSDLSDVNTSTPTNRNVLVADGVDWESRALTEADISDLQSYLLATDIDTLAELNTIVTDATLASQAWVTSQGYLTSFTETNDLTAAVTWANVPDANITQSSVTQHQAALTITESQISDLSHFTPTNLLTDYGFTDNSTNWNTAFGWGDHSLEGYLTTISGLSHTLLSDIGTNTHVQIDNHITDSTIHFTQASISITESQISDLQTYLLDITGETLSNLSDVPAEPTGGSNNYILVWNDNTDTFSWIVDTTYGGGFTDIDTDYGTETVTSAWTMNALTLGGNLQTGDNLLLNSDSSMDLRFSTSRIAIVDVGTLQYLGLGNTGELESTASNLLASTNTFRYTTTGLTLNGTVGLYNDTTDDLWDVAFGGVNNSILRVNGTDGYLRYFDSGVNFEVGGGTTPSGYSFYVDHVGNSIIGDISSAGNRTFLEVSDTFPRIRMSTSGDITIGDIIAGSTITVGNSTNLVTFADFNTTSNGYWESTVASGNAFQSTNGDLSLTNGDVILTNGDVTVTNGQITEGGNRVLTYNTKSITIESPTSSEDIGLFFTDDAITITQINAVQRGTTPSVTYTIRHSTDRSATGNEVVTGGSTTTSTTTGDEVTVFNDATIPAGSWIWIETTAQSGTSDELTITIEYTKD